ncbi:hypothetical protein C5167_008302 [Papaver somniferum]|uniref:Uncharacterized protein n=1 Tax=Papaver somniferum TaxID=3469 RepID=A0A4Y7JV70_PAPSO|nr:hypothetical protein C5167_008302 [Papaver somniferum]
MNSSGVIRGIDVGEGRDLLSILPHFGNPTNHMTSFHQCQCRNLLRLQKGSFQRQFEEDFFSSMKRVQ